MWVATYTTGYGATTADFNTEAQATTWLHDQLRRNRTTQGTHYEITWPPVLPGWSQTEATA